MTNIVSNDRKLPPVTFDQICPKYARKMRKNGGLSRYMQNKVINEYECCIVGEARTDIEYETLEIKPNPLLKLFGAKTKKSPEGCVDCKKIAEEFGHLVEKKQSLTEIIDAFVAHYNAAHLEEYYQKHPIPKVQPVEAEPETPQIKEKIRK